MEKKYNRTILKNKHKKKNEQQQYERYTEKTKYNNNKET
jgi:hypothetical protein